MTVRCLLSIGPRQVRWVVDGTEEAKHELERNPTWVMPVEKAVRAFRGPNASANSVTAAAQALGRAVIDGRDTGRSAGVHLTVRRAIAERIASLPAGDRMVVDVVTSGGEFDRWPWELLECETVSLVGQPGVVWRRVVKTEPVGPVALQGSSGTPLTAVFASGPHDGTDRPLCPTGSEPWISTGTVVEPLVRVPGTASVDDIVGRLGGVVVDMLVIEAHGSVRGLLLAGGDGAHSRWVSGAELAQRVAGRVRLVVLLVCNGTDAADGGQSVAASLAAAGVPVIAANQELLSSTGEAFSKVLARNLKDRHTLHRAFVAARNEVAADLQGKQGAVYGLFSLWQPSTADVALRPPSRATVGMPLAPPDPRFDHFVGRAEVLEAIRAFVADPGQRVLGVVGGPGTGKSRLLRYLAGHPEAAGAKTLAALLRDPDPGTDIAPLEISRLLRMAGEALAEVKGGPDELETWRARFKSVQGEAVDRFAELVGDLPGPDPPRIILIDAIDELDRSEARSAYRDLLGRVLPLLPTGVKVIVSARHVDQLPRPNHRDVDARVDLADHDEPEALRGLAHLVLASDAGIAPNVTGEARRRLADEIGGRADGVFLYVKAVLKAIGTGFLEPDLSADLLDTPQYRLPAGLDDLYDQLPHRIEDWPRYRDLLAVACACQDSNGFSIDELVDLTDRSEVDLRDDLDGEREPMIATLLPRSQDRYRPFHASFADWILDAHNGATARYAHETIARSLERVLLPEERLANVPLAAYYRQHGGVHLLRSMESTTEARRWAFVAFAERYCETRIVEERIWEQGAIAVGSEIDQAIGFGAQVRPSWPAVITGVAMASSAARTTRTSLLGIVHHQAQLANDRDLVDWCEQRLAATGLSHVLTSAETFPPARHVGEGRTAGPVRGVAFNPNGDLLASASTGSHLRIFDVDRYGRTGNHPIDSAYHYGSVMAVAFSSDGALAATGSSDGTLRTFGVDAYGRVSEEHLGIAATRSRVLSVVFNPRCPLIAISGDDCMVKVFSVDRHGNLGQEPLSTARHDGTVWSVGFDPNGTLLVSGSNDGRARIYAVGSDGEIGSNPVRIFLHEKPVHAVAFNCDGTLLATGSNDGMVRMFSVDQGGHHGEEPLDTISHDGPARTLAFHPGGSHIATGSADGQLRMFALEPHGRFGREPVDRVTHDGEVKTIAFNGEGTLLATGTDKGQIRVFAVDQGGRLGPSSAEATMFNGWSLSVAFNKSGTLLASGDTSGHARVFARNAGGGWGQRPSSIIDHNRPVWSVAFGGESKRSLLATATGNGEVQVIKAHEHGLLDDKRLTLDKHHQPVWSAAFDREGGRLATDCDDGKLRIFGMDYDGHQGRLLDSVAHQGAVWAVAFSPQYNLIATGSDNGLIQVFGVDSCGHLTEEPVDCRDLNGPVWSCAFNAEGTLLASGSNDRRLRMFTVDHQGCLSDEPIDFVRHDSPVWSVAFSSQGGLIATAANDAQVRIFSVGQGGRLDLMQVLPIGASINRVTFGPDALAVASDGVRMLRVVEVPGGV